MKVVTSKFQAFPWAFTWPENMEASADEFRAELSEWYVENGLRYNHDYVTFEMHEPKKNAWENPWDDPIKFSCVAFKHQHHALMFKMRWA
jgi:hypothetical protein